MFGRNARYSEEKWRYLSFQMTKQTAIVIGATGLTGSFLVEQLLRDERFDKVKVFARRSTNLQHSKLQEFIIDFENRAGWEKEVKGDVLFSALGTTIRQAGSKDAQYRIDHTYQYGFAEAAARNDVPVYVLLSSAGANAQSSFFYMRIKGELENAVAHLPFFYIRIIQPGPLDGPRREKRGGEKLGLTVIRFLNRLGLAKRMRPIHVSVVARAMINASQDRTEKSKRYALDELFTLAKNEHQGNG